MQVGNQPPDQNTPQGVFVQLKNIVGLVVSIVTLMTACVGAIAWSVGKYTAITDTIGALDRRVVVLETTNVTMAGDVKETKAMLIQLMTARGDRQEIPRYQRR